MDKGIPIPPFTLPTASPKVQMAEDVWNSKDLVKIVLTYTIESEWRNRSTFINGRKEIIQFLIEKWRTELDYKLKKELWTFRDNRIAVMFEYEYHDNNDQWFRSYGNENWEFDENGLMRKRFASINDVAITIAERHL
ncbi:MAG: nuclear transport factor 2 family protein [Ferruginibacter sp.]